ncbi:MAG: DEAD/DEAH box helicase [Anaerolineae bacterium]|nr:DEAD/DEAH box helicase [Anaerolineae bacterium]
MAVFVALDLETTGLDPERDAIIEIGAVKFRDDQVLSEFNTFVNPGRSIPFEITVLTGITDQDVAQAPRLQSVLPGLAQFVGDAPVVGHNVGFDLSFLRRWTVLLSNRSVDTFSLATTLVPEADRYSLLSLATLLGFPPQTSHRAIDDACASYQLFQKLLDRACTLPLPLLEELVEQGERCHWPPADFFRYALRIAARGAVATDEAWGRDLPASPAFAVSDKAQPLEPAEVRRPLDVDALAGLLEQGGAFSTHFPGYENRPQQVQMLRAVADALNEGRHLMVEAPTGVGKSLAYLIPAVAWGAQNGERVVISTNTINLQEQLYYKDLPDLAGVVPLAFRAAVLKGRSHYLCPARLAALQRSGPASPEEMAVLSRVLVWLTTTRDGDGDTLFLPTAQDQAMWGRLSADFEGCNPERCRYFHEGACFFYRARKAAEAAHLLIINHALLLADVSVQNRALPEYRFLIVDEAHHLEAATTGGLSFKIDRNLIRRVLAEVGATQARDGDAAADVFNAGILRETIVRCEMAQLDRDVMAMLYDAVRKVGRAAHRARRALETFFDQLEAFVEDASGGRMDTRYAFRLRVTGAERVQPAWDAVEVAWDDAVVPVFSVSDGLEQLAGGLDDLDELGVVDVEGLQGELIGLSRKLADIQGHLNTFVTQPSRQTIYWVEMGPEQMPLSVHAAPLHVGPLVQEHLFHKKEAVILTSATLRTGESFDFLRERLHATEADELAVDSPFDYAQSALVYLVEDIPEPGHPGYQNAVSEGMAALFRATQGRALGLFTSYSQLRATASAVTPLLKRDNIVVYTQGQGLSRNQLLENFRTSGKAVLLGTRSFWEGVDVPGEALSCLAIAKLPFSVPNDPVFAARSETFDAPFFDYAVPDAVLRFMQGFGRLIRTRTDRGIAVIFDRRIISKSYGQLFLDSLPGPIIQRGSVLDLPKVAAEWLNGQE